MLGNPLLAVQHLTASREGSSMFEHLSIEQQNLHHPRAVATFYHPPKTCTTCNQGQTGGVLDLRLADAVSLVGFSYEPARHPLVSCAVCAR